MNNIQNAQSAGCLALLTKDIYLHAFTQHTLRNTCTQPLHIYARTHSLTLTIPPSFALFLSPSLCFCLGKKSLFVSFG